MPFGAQITKAGVRFRLWAPGSQHVTLCLEGEHHEPILPMMKQEDGWFELTVHHAGPGTQYRFEVNEGMRVPDPASRWNPDDVHGASEVIDPSAFQWQDDTWQGRPWEEAVVYELHVGTFTPEGTFAGVLKKLDYLVKLGVTAIELMPVADFPGQRDWGYDGALLFAPDSRYGRPEDLKALIQAAHQRGLMVLLDVVYNHFGPEGNYLYVYARKFFTERHHTPWGAAINFDGDGSDVVREFFIQNALYWLEEYRFDGLRLDAVHAIIDDSKRHILIELSERVHSSLGGERHVHLILENDANEARYLGGEHYVAQWNDDIHHALHVLCTGEADGYYADYADRPIHHLGRCLAEGFAYQGEASLYRDHALRGEPSGYLPAQSFVSFLQCHDQVGNRAFGERITHLAPEPAVRAAAAVYLLAPSVPMMFMGEEFAATTPFQFFCDFGDELRDAVTQGRRHEFARFQRFADPETQAKIPDPNLEQTFLNSKLDWDSLKDENHGALLAYYRKLLQLRKDTIVPHLQGMGGHKGKYVVVGQAGLRVMWQLQGGTLLHLLANFSNETVSIGEIPGKVFFATSPEAPKEVLGPWSVLWAMDNKEGDS